MPDASSNSLVTGGAGYIGSHAGKALVQAGAPLLPMTTASSAIAKPRLGDYSTSATSRTERVSTRGGCAFGEASP